MDGESRGRNRRVAQPRADEELRAKEAAAAAAQKEADAQRARMDAERLERQAHEQAAEADRARQAAQAHLDDASRLAPPDQGISAPREERDTLSPDPRRDTSPDTLGEYRGDR